MEIKRQVEAKKLKYPENIITYSKRITSFSGLLFFMLSGYVEARRSHHDAVSGGDDTVSFFDSIMVESYLRFDKLGFACNIYDFISYCNNVKTS